MNPRLGPSVAKIFGARSARWHVALRGADGKQLLDFGPLQGVGRAALALALSAVAIASGSLIYSGRAWQRAALRSQALAEASHAVLQRTERIEALRAAIRPVMADNTRTLIRLTEKQGIPVDQLVDPAGSAGQSAEASSQFARGPTAEAMAQATEFGADAEALWARARRQQAALAQLGDYWQHAERRLRHTPSIRPAATAWNSSSYGIRHDPMSHALIMHKGLDMAGFTGMIIRAPADGTVIWTGVRGGYGQTVVIDHGWGIQTHFAHLSKYSVRMGAAVRRNAPIAEMGSTGKSTGPHLHYEVRLDGYPVNPIKFILD